MLCKRMAVMAITAGLVADTLAFTGTHLLLVPGASPSTRARSPALCMAALQPKPVRPVAVKSIFVDEQRMLKDQKFPIAPDDLIAKAKIFLESRGGFGADPDLLADDFKFYGPVVRQLFLLLHTFQDTLRACVSSACRTCKFLMHIYARLVLSWVA